MSFEKTDCQYCGDAGLCTFCERGKIAIAEHQKGQVVDNTSKPEEAPEIKLTWADPDDGLGGFSAQGDITNTPEGRE